MQYITYQSQTYQNYSTKTAYYFLLKDIDTISKYKENPLQRSVLDEIEASPQSPIHSLNTISPEQLKTIYTEVHYLVSSWLDEFERKLFDGQTLQELLHEKGGI